MAEIRPHWLSNQDSFSAGPKGGSNGCSLLYFHLHMVVLSIWDEKAN